MSNATKPLDPTHRRPFRRVDNQAFIPSKALDGKGVDCGCHIQKDLGNIDDKIDKFLLDSRDNLLGKALGTFIDGVKAALHPSKLAQILVDLIREKLGDVPAKIFEIPLKILGGLGEILLKPVNTIIDPIISIIDGAARTFMRLFATPILLRAIRVIPQWVSVTPGVSNALVDRSQVIEIEGICVRSFGNPVDVPLANWHTWFAWNVQVVPEPEYRQALSPASDPPNTSGADAGERSTIKAGSFEIQWDAGAMFADQSLYESGFAEGDMPKADAPFVTPVGFDDNGTTDFRTSFFWPMAGMFVWASGRHVYDCSRVTHKGGTTSGRDAEDDPPLMCAMIQPARALATARFQAFRFIENGEFDVPAVEFIFVATQRGGYISHETLADEDYVFILDLPPGPPAASPYPIANTDKVPHNTITLRPRLLKKITFLRPVGSVGTLPILELLPPPQPGQAPQQVRVTITQGMLKGVAAYAFRLSLGWHDPTREFARRVIFYEVEIKKLVMRLTDRDNPAQKMRNLVGKDREAALRQAILAELGKIEVEVPFIKQKIKPMDIPAIKAIVEPIVATLLDKLITALVDLMPTESEEEWLLRLGVNGTWATAFKQPRIKRDDKGKNKPEELPANGLIFRLSLAEGDDLRFAVHGTEFDPVGDIMRTARDKRTLLLPPNNDALPWSRIAKPKDQAELDSIVFAFMRRLMFDTTGGVGKLSLGFDNTPLGLIDPDQDGNRGADPKVHNPLVAKDVFDPPAAVTRKAAFSRAIAPEMVLVEDPGKPDYEIVYTVKALRQIKDAPPPAA